MLGLSVGPFDDTLTGTLEDTTVGYKLGSCETLLGSVVGAPVEGF